MENLTRLEEKRLAEDVDEFCNECDYSVGLEPLWKIGKDFVIEFEEAFDGVKVTDYDEDYLNFKLCGGTYRIERNGNSGDWQLVCVI